MLGAIAGDIIGSVHEFVETKTTDFPSFVAESQFTDDTVLTVAVADCLLTGSSYGDKFHDYARAYPKCGYGLRFLHWVYEGRREAYNSWGNGSAMRVSPVAFAFETFEEVVKQSRATAAEVTHNHPEGIRGAEATAAATFLARRGASKKEIRDLVEDEFGYDLSFTIAEMRPTYEFNESLQDIVPQVITAFLESKGYETLSGSRFLWAAMPTHWLALRAESPGHFMAVFLLTLRTPAWNLLDDRLRTVVTDCTKFQIKLS